VEGEGSGRCGGGSLLLFYEFLFLDVVFLSGTAGTECFGLSGLFDGGTEFGSGFDAQLGPSVSGFVIVTIEVVVGGGNSGGG